LSTSALESLPLLWLFVLLKPSTFIKAFVPINPAVDIPPIIAAVIEETDPLLLSKLQENGQDPYLMNKSQIEKQYLLWNREQRPTSFTTDLLSEAE
jgi:hypothetical protein